MTAAIANGGTVWKPQVVQKIVDLDGETEWLLKAEKLNETIWPKTAIEAVRKAMESVVNDVGGTAWRSRLKKVRFAGKTGTAQVVRRQADDEEELEDDQIPYKHRDHALFVSYAPAQNPQIAIAVVVEHGSHGSTAAAPVAKAMFDAYFEDASDNEEPEKVVFRD
jgi:penicillin-binding protein 2